MKFLEAKESITRAASQLDCIWWDAYQTASNIIGGNWQDPEVIKRRREKAEEIADKMMSNTKLTITWEKIDK